MAYIADIRIQRAWLTLCWRRWCHAVGGKDDTGNDVAVYMTGVSYTSFTISRRLQLVVVNVRLITKLAAGGVAAAVKLSSY